MKTLPPSVLHRLRRLRESSREAAVDGIDSRHPGGSVEYDPSEEHPAAHRARRQAPRVPGMAR